MSLIEFQDVSFTYDGETFALKDINLSIEQGEFVCILGEMGRVNQRSLNTLTHSFYLTKVALSFLGMTRKTKP